MLRRGMTTLVGTDDVTLAELRPERSAIRWTTYLGIAVGLLDVVTTAEHLLVPPVADGNPLLMEVGRVSPELSYAAFVCWFLLVAGVALVHRGGLGYGADTYLFLAFGAGGIANTSYFLFGTMLFKDLVGQYPFLYDLYILLLAPLGSLLVGVCWARLS